MVMVILTLIEELSKNFLHNFTDADCPSFIAVFPNRRAAARYRPGCER
jgi:hypothetical protein